MLNQEDFGKSEYFWRRKKKSHVSPNWKHWRRIIGEELFQTRNATKRSKKKIYLRPHPLSCWPSTFEWADETFDLSVLFSLDNTTTIQPLLTWFFFSAFLLSFFLECASSLVSPELNHATDEGIRRALDSSIFWPLVLFFFLFLWLI